MISILGAPLTGADSFTVSGCIILREDTGVGIQKVEVKDRFGVVILGVNISGCPTIAEVCLETVSRDRLPVFLDVTNCNGGKFSSTVPVWTSAVDAGDPSIPLSGSALLCVDNRRCREAEGAALRARNEVVERCNDVRSIRGRRDAAAAAAVALTTAAVALVAAGISAFSIPLFGAAIGAVLLGVAAGLAYMAVVQGLLAWREQQRLDAAEAKLAAARSRFTDAADRANMLCGRDCRTVDLTQPEC